MILEIVQFKIKEEAEQEFLENVAEGIALFGRAKGCEGVELLQSGEAPGEYRLLVRWQTLENHIVDFRSSDDFAKWRTLTAHCYAESPIVVNWEVAVKGFGFDYK